MGVCMYMRRGMRSRFSLLCLLVLCLGCSCSAGGCFSVKSVYINSSYPIPEGPLKKRDWAQNLASYLVPTLAVGYRQPKVVGACLRKMNKKPQLVRNMLRFGRCVAAKKPTLAVWKACLQTHFPWIQIQQSGRAERCVSKLPCSTPLSPEDQMNFSVALASTASLLYAYQRLTFGRTLDMLRFTREHRQALQKAIDNAALLLEQDPHNQMNAEHANRATLPTLALSGGGPNGAFISGFMHAMLSFRELALAASDVSEAHKKIIRNRYRFGGASATSVGSLIAVALDLYFSNPKKPLSKKVKAALRTCLGSRYQGNVRDLQRCALHKLVQDFDVHGWDYLCVEKGSAIPVFVGKKKNLLRFDPLKKTLIDPMYRAYGDLMLNNDFIRVAMAIGLDQNLLVGLDERACRRDPSTREACFSSGLMASISEPGQISAVPRVFSGLTQSGEKGVWYDGGVRSALPSKRAALMTYGRVLALSTGRLLGEPASYSNGFNILVGSAGQAIGQNALGELSQTHLFQAQRAIQRTWLTACFKGGKSPLKPHLACIAPEHRNVQQNTLHRLYSPSPSKGGLWPVFVPENIQPGRLLVAGYTFDPYVMRGLFLWGQRTFFQRRRALFRWLGWTGMFDLEKGCKRTTKKAVSTSQPVRTPWACAPQYKASIKAFIRASRKELRTRYLRPKVPHDLKWWQEHAKKGKKQLSKKITMCASRT